MSVLSEQDRNQLEDDLEQQIGKNAFDAIESAILAKLASAELPEPDCVLSTNRYGSSPDAYPVFTADQLHQAFAQGFAAGAAAQLAEKPVGCVVVHGKHKVGMLPAQRDIEAGETLYTRREAK